MKNKNILWIGLGAVVATAAVIFFIRKKKQENDEKPPKNAPQLSVGNPGDQSEFRTTASESEVG